MTAHPKKSESIELKRFIVQEIALMTAKGIKTGVFEDWTVANKIADKAEALYNQRMEKAIGFDCTHTHNPECKIENRIKEEIRTRAGINKKEDSDE